MILDTLITDRTAADVARVKALSQKGFAAMTAAEQAEYLQPMKGVYNATDLNRVQEACEYVANRLHQYGYAVDVQKIPHQRGGQSRLPEGYTELVSIQSSGTQYIDTGFAVTPQNYQTLKLEIDCVKSGSDSWRVDGVGDGGVVSFHVGTHGGYLYYGNGKSDVSTGKTCDGSTRRTYTIDASNSKVYATGIAETNISLTTPTASANMCLFAYGTRTSAYPFAETVYAAKIYQANNIVRDFVPCKNPSNVIGLYDLVTEQFFGNAGTGAFVAGEVVPVPIIVDYTWIMSDIPTPAEMSVYIANIQNLRNVFTIAAPQAPSDAERMTHQEANNIEIILLAVDELLNRVIQSFVFSGQVNSGMVWEEFTNV